MTTASTFKWDPKFKQCFDSVDMNDHHCQFEQSDFHVAGLLEQVSKLSHSAIWYHDECW